MQNRFWAMVSKLVLLMQILKAISDGLDCRGYYIWTLVDKYAPALVHCMPCAKCLLADVLGNSGLMLPVICTPAQNVVQSNSSTGNDDL